MRAFSDASRAVQNLISSTQLPETFSGLTFVIHIQDGPNGNYRQFAEKAISDALRWFTALGLMPPQPRIDYIFGRTTPWLEQQVVAYAPGCLETAQRAIPGWKPVYSGALCPDRQRAAVYSHIVHSVVPGACCGTPDSVSAVTDLSRYPLSRDVWHMLPHETFHLWQGATRGFSHVLPNWMNEGAAQLFAYMLWAKLQGRPDAYLLLNPEEVGWEKRQCTTPVSTPQNPGCNYSQGMVAMEYFVFRFGIEGYKRLWSGISRADVSSEFERILGVPYAEFERDLNAHLRQQGWGG